MGYGVTHALWGCEGRLGGDGGVDAAGAGAAGVWTTTPGESLDRAALDGAAALVRCEDLARGRRGRRLRGWRGAVRAVGSSDGLRAVGVYGELGWRRRMRRRCARGGLGRGWRGVGEIDGGGRAEAGCAEDPHPSPLPRGEGEGADGPRQGRLRQTLVGCAEDPSLQPSPPGRGRKSGCGHPMGRGRRRGAGGVWDGCGGAEGNWIGWGVCLARAGPDVLVGAGLKLAGCGFVHGAGAGPGEWATCGLVRLQTCGRGRRAL